jgi:ABC-type iron transport system FetAB permease component
MPHFWHSLDAPTSAAGASEPVIDIPTWKLSLIIILLGIPLSISIFARLKLHRALMIGAVRCVVQLLLLGMILRTLFAHAALHWVAGYIFFMMMVASFEAHVRPSMSYDVRHFPLPPVSLSRPANSCSTVSLPVDSPA